MPTGIQEHVCLLMSSSLFVVYRSTDTRGHQIQMTTTHSANMPMTQENTLSPHQTNADINIKTPTTPRQTCTRMEAKMNVKWKMEHINLTMNKNQQQNYQGSFEQTHKASSPKKWQGEQVATFGRICVSMADNGGSGKKRVVVCGVGACIVVEACCVGCVSSLFSVVYYLSSSHQFLRVFCVFSVSPIPST